MNRTRFLINLAKQNKTGHVTDVGEVNIVPQPSTSAKSTFSSLESNSEKSNDSFHDFSDSGSEYIPSDISENESDTESVIIPYAKEVKIFCKNLLVNEPEVDSLLATNFENSNEVPSCSPNEKNKDMTENVQEYLKKSNARERPTICPLCFNTIPTHFTRHLFRHHKNNKEVMTIKTLKPKSKERLALVASMRKQGYFHLNNEKGVLNPVRNSKHPDTKHFVCTFCLGYYSKKLLYKHVKLCKQRPKDIEKPGKNCLSKSQTFAASLISKNHEFLKHSRLKAEVFNLMRADDISSTAKNDPMICLYGEALLNKHKRKQMSTVISNKIREMGRLLIALRSTNQSIKGLFYALKPEFFGSFVSAAKLISGYNVETKTFKAPSLALHMGTNLKLLCDVALKIVIEKKDIPNILWTDGKEKKTEIKELKKLIEAHWCNELSSLALKNLNENHWSKPIEVPSTTDILALQNFVNTRADEAYKNLNDNNNIRDNYKILTECVLVLTIMFNRKRVGDVQYLKIENYNSSTSATNEEAFQNSLTPVEKIIASKFKRIVVGGKGSKPVPILFSSRMQKFIKQIIEIRNNTCVVPKSNPYLFANPSSESRWMNGVNVMRKLASKCGAKNATLLTSTKFRKHIATTLQLMSMEDNEMEQVASFMGHTKKTHQEFYRLPQDIFQTAKVAKVLLLLEKGKGHKFKGKNLNDLELEQDVYYSSEEESNDKIQENLSIPEKILKRSETDVHSDLTEVHGDVEVMEGSSNKNNGSEPIRAKQKSSTKSNNGSSKGARHRWSEKEKCLVLKHFKIHIKKKVPPKKHECEELMFKHKDILGCLTWVQIKTLVYNEFRDKN